MDPKVELPLTPGAGHQANETELHQKVAGSLGVKTEEVQPVTADSKIIEAETGEQFDQMINPNDTQDKPSKTEIPLNDDNPTGITGAVSETGELARQVLSSENVPVRTAPSVDGLNIVADRKAKQGDK